MKLPFEFSERVTLVHSNISLTKQADPSILCGRDSSGTITVGREKNKGKLPWHREQHDEGAAVSKATRRVVARPRMKRLWG